jgi:hypothetical protein
MTDLQKYTLTIYIAAPGTPLAQERPGDTSVPGHMFYAINDGTDNILSYGFAPIKQGTINGPGHIANNDVENYKDPLYSRTMEISKGQYDKLKEYGTHAAQHGFDTQYKDIRNNCVDFTWAALNHAGIKQQSRVGVIDSIFGHDGKISSPADIEGKSSLRPAQNIDDVKTIKDPIPGSPLNKEHSNPMPKRDLLQHILSDIPLDNPSHPGNPMYQQAYEGVGKLNAQHQVPASDRDKNFAGFLATTAKAGGLDRIDHVVLSDDGNKAFAVQGQLGGTLGLNRQIVGMQTMDALNTPLTQSSAQWEQAAEQYQQLQQQVQAQQQNLPQQASPQQAPVMQI